MGHMAHVRGDHGADSKPLATLGYRQGRYFCISTFQTRCCFARFSAEGARSPSGAGWQIAPEEREITFETRDNLNEG